MSDAIQTDAEMARNEPVEVFAIARDGGRAPEKIKVKALPIDKAEAWMEKANEVEVLHRQLETAQKGTDRAALFAARKAYNKAVVDCVFAYDELQERADEFRAIITPAQLSRAFAILQLLNDPFVSAGVVQLNIQREAMKGLPMEAILKHASGNGSTNS